MVTNLFIDRYKLFLTPICYRFWPKKITTFYTQILRPRPFLRESPKFGIFQKTIFLKFFYFFPICYRFSHHFSTHKAQKKTSPPPYTRYSQFWTPQKIAFFLSKGGGLWLKYRYFLVYLLGQKKIEKTTFQRKCYLGAKNKLLWSTNRFVTITSSKK